MLAEGRDVVFLVEGDSAGGSAKMGRDKETQAVLPLRGKVLNSWEVEPGRLFANAEIHDIAVSLGIDPHGPGDSPDLSGLRYGKLIIIKHNKTFLTAYAHNNQLLVKEGQVVNKGQKIAEMGSSDADQVKLHFEIRRFGKPVDPQKYLGNAP